MTSLTMYPQVRPDWQIHLWEHPSRNCGCIVASKTGKVENIGIPLARLLRRMTGARSVGEIVGDVAGAEAQTADAAGLIGDTIDMLVRKQVVNLHEAAQPPRSFARAVPHEHLLRILQLQLTNQCNLKCDHCYAGSDAHGHRGMTLDEIKSIIDEFVDLGGIRLFLTGGEALLRPDLEEIITYAKQKYLFVYLNTNGFSVTPERAKRLVALGIGAVNVSVDGADAETHDAFRRRKGSFDRAIRAIDAFCDEGVPVGVQMTLNKRNLGQTVALYDQVHPKGVSQCYFVRMVPQGRAEKFDDLIPTAEEFYHSMVEIEMHRAKPPAPAGTAGPGDAASDIRKGTRCTAGTAQVYVRSDGECYPCTALDRDQLSMGHYPTLSLEAIWTRQHGAAQDLRDFNHGKIEHCQGCSRQVTCKGGCAGNALSLLGDWRRADPNGCVMREVKKTVAKAQEAELLTS